MRISIVSGKRYVARGSRQRRPESDNEPGRSGSSWNSTNRSRRLGNRRDAAARAVGNAAYRRGGSANRTRATHAPLSSPRRVTPPVREAWKSVTDTATAAYSSLDSRDALVCKSSSQFDSNRPSHQAPEGLLYIERSPIKPVRANMREIVHIQAGQCGNQIGAKVKSLREVRARLPLFEGSSEFDREGSPVALLEKLPLPVARSRPREIDAEWEFSEVDSVSRGEEINRTFFVDSRTMEHGIFRMVCEETMAGPRPASSVEDLSWRQELAGRRGF